MPPNCRGDFSVCFTICFTLCIQDVFLCFYRTAGLLGWDTFYFLMYHMHSTPPIEGWVPNSTPRCFISRWCCNDSKPALSRPFLLSRAPFPSPQTNGCFHGIPAGGHRQRCSISRVCEFIRVLHTQRTQVWFAFVESRDFVGCGRRRKMKTVSIFSTLYPYTTFSPRHFYAHQTTDSSAWSKVSTPSRPAVNLVFHPIHTIDSVMVRIF